jgi:uncharacterized protein (DUF983 family)
VRVAGLEHADRGNRGIGQKLSDGTPRLKLKPTLFRALRRRCPVCGHPKIFSGYFTLKRVCPNCDYEFAREEGYWVGAVIMNLAVTEGIFFVVLVATVIATAPDVNWVYLLVIGMVTNLLFPVVFYPFSKTIWMVVDLVFMKRLER